MGERDEKLIKLGMEKNNFSREKVLENMDTLVEIGLVERVNDNFQLSDDGIRWAEGIFNQHQQNLKDSLDYKFRN